MVPDRPNHLSRQFGRQSGCGREGAGETAEFTLDSLKDEEAYEEHAYSAEQLAKIAFRNADRQMEILSKLPDVISTAHSDDDLGHMLSALLLEAIPKALAVAVAHFDETELPPSADNLENFPKPSPCGSKPASRSKGVSLPAAACSTSA